MATTTTRRLRRRFLPLVDLSMRELYLSPLGTSPSLVVSMPISPVVVVVVVVSVSTATVISIIVSGRTMVSLAVVLVLLVVSLVIAVVLAARHDEKKFLFQRGEMLCDDHKEKVRKNRHKCLGCPTQYRIGVIFLSRGTA